MMLQQKVWIVRGGVVLFFFWILLQVSAMFFHVGDGWMRGFSRFVLPPAWIGFSSASYHRVVETAHAFVALEVAPTYQEAFPLALSFVLRDVRLQDLLAEGTYERGAMRELPQEDSDVLVVAGISLFEQERYLLQPLERMEDAASLRSTALSSQDMRLQNVLEKIDLDMPFSDIARYFSEDSSAIDGGDLGVFLLGELPLWLQDVVSMEVDDVRSDFVGSDAFWVIKVVDKGGEGVEAWVHLRGIAINKPTVAAVLRSHAAEHPAYLFVW
jgi:hypothetical protein